MGDFEIPSEIEPKESDQAKEILKFNEHYDYLTLGQGKIRPRGEAEVQTEIVYDKPKATNTEIERGEKGTFVRNFDIFDTFADGDSHDKFICNIKTFEDLSHNKNFYDAAFVIEKCLSENNFGHQMMIYKNLKKSIEKSELINFEYLWTYQCEDVSHVDVVSFSWSGDILAVGYGNFTRKDQEDGDSEGYVLIWSYKNPVNPGRKFKFQVPVCDIRFSNRNPHLLAVAFNDGSLQVLDISEFTPNHLPTIAKLDGNSKLSSAPILSVRWFDLGDDDEEFIFAASVDGRVMKYQIGSGGKLIGNQQIQILRLEGPVEGLDVNHKKNFVESERFAQILYMQQHPERLGEFLIATDEGCVYTCSTIFINKTLELLQAQERAIYSLDFSPFNSKIFLTAGSDHKIRIWIEDVLEPLLEFEEKFTSSQCVKWSRIYPTIIFNCSHDGVRVWDLRRKAEKPIIIQKFTTKLTTFTFSPCGNSILIGDIKGSVQVFSLHNGVHSPSKSFRELKKVIYLSLRHREKVLHQVKQIFIASQKKIDSSKIDA